VVVDSEILDEEEFLFDRGLEEAQIDYGAWAEPGRLEFREAIVETAEPGEFRIDGETSVFVDAAIVFVEPKGGGLERAGGEITANVFFGDAIEFGVRFESGGRLG
jgi:hypothetical protein